MNKIYRFLYTAVYNLITFFWIIDTFLLGIITLSVLITALFYGVGGSLDGINIAVIIGFYVYWFAGLYFIIMVDPPDRKFPPK